MKTMKTLLIGMFFISATQFLAAQTKSTPAKVAAPGTATKVAIGKAVLPQVEIAKQIAQGQSEFSFLGSYAIHAGVQKTKIGNFTLLKDGTYNLSVNSDENSHATSSYEYDPSTKTLKWMGGMFLSKQYGGVMTKSSNGKLRILLSSSTYAEKID